MRSDRKPSLALALVALAAMPARAEGPSEARKIYEQKCLYCHSGAAAERKRATPSQWRQLVELMRARAPLLISRKDADAVVRYFVHERRQVRAEPGSGHAAPHIQPTAPHEPPPTVGTPRQAGAAVCCEGSSPCCSPPSPPIAAEPEPEDPEAEARGPRLLAERCTKCHTLRRAFQRIDSVEVGHALIERMRRKMGSGITPDDVAMLDRFLRSRITRAR